MLVKAGRSRQRAQLASNSAFSVSGGSSAFAMAREQRYHLVVLDLLEVAVELAHGHEALGRLQADELVGVGPDLLEAVGRRDRHGAHQARGLLRAHPRPPGGT